MEGMLYSMLSFGKAIYKLDYKGLKELWKNDTKRANFYLFLHDMVWMSILMAIMRAIMSNTEEMGPAEHMVTTAMYTSFSDGPIHEVVKSMFGDLNPPAVGVIKNIFNNTSAVITGDKNLFEGLTGTFGMLNDLRYIGNKLE